MHQSAAIHEKGAKGKTLVIILGKLNDSQVRTTPESCSEYSDCVVVKERFRQRLAALSDHGRNLYHTECRHDSALKEP